MFGFWYGMNGGLSSGIRKPIRGIWDWDSISIRFYW